MNPMELAEQLGEAILASDEYKYYTGAKEAMDNSNEANNLVETFQDRQQSLRDSQLTGRKVTQEQIDELRAHQRTMLDNPEISAYLEAKKNVDTLLAAVNEVISRVTGMESGGHSHGAGGCGGGCC
jgi:cell fate (sporulation/competence/biofilm development) regulator YlbF (YheA/YmcA/DUF963 family)